MDFLQATITVTYQRSAAFRKERFLANGDLLSGTVTHTFEVEELSRKQREILWDWLGDQQMLNSPLDGYCLSLVDEKGNLLEIGEASLTDTQIFEHIQIQTEWKTRRRGR